MNPRIVLLGGGGHASDVLTVVESTFEEREILIADDADVRHKRFEGRATVLNGDLDGAFLLDARFLNAVGYPVSRRHVVNRADRAGVEWHEAVLHPDTTVHRSVHLGRDTVVLGQVWLSAHVEIGPHTHVGYGATIGHDSKVGAFCSIMPAACVGGDVTVGDDVLIGANATVLQGISIGDHAVIGAGAVVVRDVVAGSTVVGVPAREISQDA